MRPFDKLIREDYIMGIVIFLNLGARVLTQYLIHRFGELSEGILAAEQVVTAFESNPIAALIINANKQAFVLEYVLMPAFIVGFYVFMRYFHTIRNNDRLHRATLGFIVALYFISTAIDFLNNLGIYLGVAMRGI